MNEQLTHLVINWISIENNKILVGATDNTRWAWDIKEGMSGGNAKSVVYVTLTDHGKDVSISEEAGFHCPRGDSTRTLAMTGLIELYKIAWLIKDDNLDVETALERYFGMEINKADLNM